MASEKSATRGQTAVAVSDARNRVIQADYKLWAACKKLLSSTPTADAIHPAIVAGVPLIGWCGGNVPPDKRKLLHCHGARGRMSLTALSCKSSSLWSLFDARSSL